MIYWQDLVVSIYIVELILIFFFLLLIPFHRIYLYRKNLYEIHAQDEISKNIATLIQNPETISPLTPLRKYRGSRLLLSVVESFDKQLNSNEWEQIKAWITTTFLLKKARNWTYKGSWIKRNFSARCFALTALSEDEKYILTLAKDPVFLVASIASIACFKLENKEAIIQVIHNMSREKGFTRVFYRDFFANQSARIVNWIKDFAETKKGPAIHLACLEILSEKPLGKVPGYIQSDLKSENASIRQFATKIVATNPNNDTLETIAYAAKDPEYKVRLEAVSGYFFFPQEESFNMLKFLMKDPNAQVRLKAAQTLWKMGPQGIEILKRQKQEIDPGAYEAAQVALDYQGI